ncbi:MAG TPA: hypothetical protein VMU27_03630 [Candidatus Paceibacterota bacterium]|nr:hypothetical protein [Candidatus Paceibacterota bacterium]
MFKNTYLGTVLAIILSVNIGAWALSVATSSNHSPTTLTVPVTPPALQSESLPASVEASQAALPPAENSGTSTEPDTTAP